MKRILLFLAVIPFLLPFVLADVEQTSFDTWLTTEETCGCSVTQHNVHIFNSGRDNSFIITLDGKDVEKAGFAYQSVFVRGGETITVPLYFNIPCDEKELTYSVTVATLDGLEKTLAQESSVHSCASLHITPLVTEQESLPCRPLHYSFRIENIGATPDTYSFSTSRFNKETTFSPEKVTLAPNVELIVTATSRPACTVSGEQRFNIEVTSSQNEQAIPVVADITPAYDYIVQAGQLWNGTFVPQEEVYEVCKDVPSIIPLKISNDGAVHNTYDISVNGEATLGRSRVYLQQESSTLVPLYFVPREEGQVVFLIDVHSAFGSDQKLGLPLKVENCYDIQLFIPDIVRVNDTEVSFPIVNVGTKPATVEVAASLPSFMSVEDSLFVVDKQRALTVEFDSFPEGKYFGRFALRVDNGHVINDDVSFIIGKPFLYTHQRRIVGSIVVLAVLILLITGLLYSTREKRFKLRVERRSRGVSKKTQRAIGLVKAGVEQPVEEKKIEKKVVKKVVKKEKKEKIKKRKNWPWVLLILILIAAALFFIPFPTVSPNLSNSTIAHEFPVNNLARIDLGDLFPQANLSVTDGGNLSHHFVKEVVYLWSNKLGETRFVVEDGYVPVTVVGPVNNTWYESGLQQYKTASFFVYDYVRTLVGILVIIVIVLLIGLLILLRKLRKADMPNPPQTPQPKHN